MSGTILSGVVGGGRRELVSQYLISFRHHACLSLGLLALFSDEQSEAQQVNLLIRHHLVCLPV